MRNFLELVLQLAVGAFALVGAAAFVNYATGWRIGLKGDAIPADPVFGGIMLALAGLSFLGLRWMNRGAKS